MALVRQLTTAVFRLIQSTNISYPGSQSAKTECLNFLVALCMRIKNNFDWWKGLLPALSLGILDSNAAQDHLRKDPSLISNDISIFMSGSFHYNSAQIYEIWNHMVWDFVPFHTCSQL